MVTLCCPKAVAEQYLGGDISFRDALRSLNKYPTTLHGTIRTNAATHRRHMLVVASGFVLGEGVWSIVALALKAASK